MNDEIISKLNDIEKEYDVKILYAVESGSRAWGFESVDSDYDVRFIYMHPNDWYISIENKQSFSSNKRDVIEYMKDELDFSGWDIRKALQLYKKSNPPLYEWLNSPTIYLEKGSLARELRKLMPQFYSPVSGMYHYLSMAQGNYRNYLKGDIVRVKKYFYVLRPIFVCMWIEIYKSQPPVEFMKLVEGLKLENLLKMEIENLYKRKKAGVELETEKKIASINEFLIDKIEYYKKVIDRFAADVVNNMEFSDLQRDVSVLDNILRACVR
jgi:uncharacterized protein